MECKHESLFLIFVKSKKNGQFINLSWPFLLQLFVFYKKKLSMKRIIQTTLYCFCLQLAIGQVVINEISYNPPESGTDSLEYIELLNTGTDAMNLEGYYVANAVSFTFDNHELAAGEHVLVAVNSGALQSLFGVLSYEWEGGLKNGGEPIELYAPDSSLVDVVDYSNGGTWPSSDDGTNGAGSTIELCNSSLDNNDGLFWTAADNDTGVAIDGIMFLGTPGAMNTVACDSVPPMNTVITIGEASEIDSDGALVRSGELVTIKGVMHSNNFRPGGWQSTIIDENNDGIGIFLGENTTNVEPVLGDEVTITGFLSQFNGLAQIGPEEFVIESEGNNLFSPTGVSALDESTESQLIELFEVYLIDESQWSGSGSGFNVDVTNGIDTFVMRIDADTEMYADASPTAGMIMNIVGIGGQFDSSSPYFEGYQFLPRTWEDFSIIESNNDLNNQGDIAIYPNPVSDVLQIETNIEDIQFVNIINIQGQLINQLKMDNALDISSLQNGMYTIQFVKSNAVASLRFVKM